MIEPTPKVYVGTYHKYNTGSLKGKWVELDDFNCRNDFYEYCEELHSDERDPELMFQDYEAPVRGIISETHIPERMWELLKLDEHEQKQVYLYIKATGYDFDDALDQYEDMFYFHRDNAWDTLEALYPVVQDIFDLNLDFVTVDVEKFKAMYTRVELDGEVYFCDI